MGFESDRTAELAIPASDPNVLYIAQKQITISNIGPMALSRIRRRHLVSIEQLGYLASRRHSRSSLQRRYPSDGDYRLSLP